MPEFVFFDRIQKGLVQAKNYHYLVSMQREEIAFFDVDHTISRRATALAFILECMKRGYINWWYLVLTPALYVLYRLFNLKIETIYRLSLPKLLGMPRSIFEDIASVAFARYLKDNLFPGALREIEELRSRGIRIILATSAPFEAVYPLAQYCGIGADDVIATQFAYSGGVFDGHLIGVPVFSRFKSSIIRSFLQSSGIDFQHCSFYSDSVHDLPLLELVGHPVAANPDFRLRKIAEKRGWNIKDFSI